MKILLKYIKECLFSLKFVPKDPIDNNQALA